MKKIYSMIMVAALLAGVAMTGCKNNNDVQEPAKEQTYKMSITASKGAENTNPANGPKKVLGLDGSTLTASWATTEEVTVYNETKGAALGGVLKPQSAGASTTLLGELSGTIEANDVLTLKFLSPSYASQDGTLEYISANCDYATASVTVASVDGGTIYTEGTANFTNQQAIVKFTLLKKSDNSSLSVSSLTINDGTNDYTVTPSSATNVLFVAIPATNTMNLTYAAAPYSYSYEKTGAGLTAGQYYEISVKMSRIVNLATVSENLTLENGDKAYGTLSGEYQISIADGATVTLDGISISYAAKKGNYPGLNCLGDATIVLGDGTTNTVVSGFDGEGYNNWPGIYVPTGKTLTINGNTGILNARCGQDLYGGSTAGIGCGFKSGSDCGNIIINGGVINASGGSQAAGIGGAYKRNCGNITINGGTVTAIGNSYGSASGYGAGIGSGGSLSETAATITCGDITITGGTVTATGGGGAAGIGTGAVDNDIAITCGKITISGGTVTATGGEDAAGIGTGQQFYGSKVNQCGDIEITGGTVIATGTGDAAGIGTGDNNVSYTLRTKCGNITITSGVTCVTATKGSTGFNSIGEGGHNSTCGTITIGGIVTGNISTSPYTYEP